MDARRHSEVEVLVVGAGPAGLTLACELARRGVACRVVERATGRPPMSRATDIHARSLELLHHLGLAAELVAQGRKVRAFNAFGGGRRVSRIDFDALESTHPYAVAVLQNDTERVLAAGLAARGGAVERGVTLVALDPGDDDVRATLRDADGREETVVCQWLVGCDGVGSTVRALAGVGYAGETYAREYVVGDVDVRWAHRHDEVHMFMGARGFLNAVALPDGATRARLLCDVPAGGPDPTAETLRALFAERVGGEGEVTGVTSVARFRVQRRLAGAYRRGRVLLAGDAAHTCSPLLGQGMNLGLQDAFNLGWKLALACRGGPAERLVASYEAERRPVARAVLLSTHAMHTTSTWRAPVARGLFDAATALASRIPVARNAAALLCSELGTSYRGSPLVADAAPSRGVAREVASMVGAEAARWACVGALPPAAGERAPAVGSLVDLAHGHHLVLAFAGGSRAAVERGAALAERVERRWSAKVRARVVASGSAVTARDRVVHDAGAAAHRRYGAEGALYVVRPDGHVGFRSMAGDEAALLAHLGSVLG